MHNGHFFSYVSLNAILHKTSIHGTFVSACYATYPEENGIYPFLCSSDIANETPTQSFCLLTGGHSQPDTLYQDPQELEQEK